MASRSRLLLFLCASLAVGFLWSGWAPRERGTWWLEVFPILLAAPVLAATYRRFPLTTLAYVLIGLHAWILLVGGHYTYAQVPLGNWLRDAWHLARNHYDRLGHFAQGFVPAIVTREVLLRHKIVRTRAWLLFLVTSVCLAISALYELIEWGAAVALGSGADAFLGTQGDPWDTQEDMATALAGALLAQLALGRVHDRALTALASRPALDSAAPAQTA